MAHLTTHAASHLASTTKTVPMWEGITPRWLLQLLPWVPVKAGVYRINKVADPAETVSGHLEGTTLPETSVAYEEEPREINLSLVQTTLSVHTRIADLYSAPHDQLNEQIRLTVAGLKERKERAVINDPTFGLLSVAAPQQRIQAGTGAPTPDDLDDLLSLVWKWPAFFLAHPRAITAFGKECTSRGIPLESVEMFGVPFTSWRGVPLVPSDKLPYGGLSTKPRRGKKMAEEGNDVGGGTAILLMRIGEEHQGVVGLHQAGLGTAGLQSLSVRKMGIDQQGLEWYMLTCYFGVAVLTSDALAVLEKGKV